MTRSRDNGTSYRDSLTSSEFKAICIAAIDDAKVSRGKRKGMLKAKCPPSRTDGAAAWQAIMLDANPYKVSIYSIMLFNDRQSAIYNAIRDALDKCPSAARGLDRDRIVLESIGAW